jgi:hypothetical protein
VKVRADHGAVLRLLGRSLESCTEPALRDRLKTTIENLTRRYANDDNEKRKTIVSCSADCRD